MRTKWIYTILVLALGLFVTSCIDRVDEPSTSGKTRTIVFRLAVDDAVGSRTTWGATYEHSDAEGIIENYINPTNLQVLIYEGATFKGKAQYVLAQPSTTPGEDYKFVADVSNLHLTDGTTYQVMVLANCGDVSSVTNLSRLPYDISDLKNGIPMWGVQKFTLNDSQDIQHFQKVIDMLRAVAKIEVALDKRTGTKMGEYTLQEVSIEPYNTRGYCAPSGVNVSVNETNDLTWEGCFNPHASLAEKDGVHQALPFTISDDGKRAIVYVPEYDNKHTSSHAATISVKLGKGSDYYTYEDAIVFYDYNNGTPTASEYNIIRNHHYKFTITGVSGGLLIKYAVNDWEYDDQNNLTQLGTYEYPTYHNPIESVAGDVHSPKYEPVLWKSQDGLGDFWGYFYFEKPQSKMWTPTFKSATLTDYEIEVWDVNGSNKLYDSNESSYQTDWSQRSDYSGWYLIKVKVINTGTPSVATVNLGISYSMGNTLTPEYLLINGTETEDIRWMDSGTNPSFIEINLIEDVSTTFNMDDDGITGNTFTTDVPTMATNKSNEVYLETKAFTACFQLTNTGNHHYWYPTLNGQKTLEGYAVRVYKGSNLIYSTYGMDAKNGFDCLKQLINDLNNWYTIKVFPICDTPSGSVPIKLGINYERGNNQPKALEINKADSSTKWPSSGYDTKYIEITHSNNP